MKFVCLLISLACALYLGPWHAPAAESSVLVLCGLAILAEVGAVRLPGFGFFSSSFGVIAALAVVPAAGPTVAEAVMLLALALRTLLYAASWRRACAEALVDATASFAGLAFMNALAVKEVWVLIPGCWIYAVFWKQAALAARGLDRSAWRRAFDWTFPHRLAARCLGPILTILAGAGGVAPLWVFPLLVGLHRAVHSELLRADLEKSETQLGQTQKALEVKQSVEQFLWELSVALSQSKDPVTSARIVCEAAVSRLKCRTAVVVEAGEVLYAVPPGSAWNGLTATQPRVVQSAEQWGVVWPLDESSLLYLGRGLGQSFDSAEYSLASALAGQAALGLQSARRYGQQASLMEAARLAAVGQLAAGLAHELNTPLGAALLRLERAQMLVPEGEAAASHLLSCQTNLERARVLLQRVLYYSKDGSQPQVQVDLVQVLQDSLEWSNLPQAQSQFVPLTPRPGNPAELQQLFLALLENARYALAEPGARGAGLYVACQMVGERRKLVVCDQGPGIPPEILSRLFEPFFTTKPVGSGLGLGLNLAQSIARRHGGLIEAANSPDPQWGAVFTVWL